jgi:hypothetical protein
LVEKFSFFRTWRRYSIECLPCINVQSSFPICPTSQYKACQMDDKFNPVVFRITRLTRRVSLVEQELLTLPEQLISPSIVSGVRNTRSLVVYVCFVDRCLSFCTFSFDHCVLCSSSIYGLSLPLWYLQTLLIVAKI